MTDLLPDRPFTLQELAERWQVSERTLRDWVHRGELPYFRVGTAYRIPQAAIEAHEAGRPWTSENTKEANTGAEPKADERAARPYTQRIVRLPSKGPRTI